MASGSLAKGLELKEPSDFLGITKVVRTSRYMGVDRNMWGSRLVSTQDFSWTSNMRPCLMISNESALLNYPAMIQTGGYSWVAVVHRYFMLGEDAATPQSKCGTCA